MIIQSVNDWTDQLEIQRNVDGDIVLIMTNEAKDELSVVLKPIGVLALILALEKQIHPTAPRRT